MSTLTPSVARRTPDAFQSVDGPHGPCSLRVSGAVAPSAPDGRCPPISPVRARRRIAPTADAVCPARLYACGQSRVEIARGSQHSKWQSDTKIRAIALPPSRAPAQRAMLRSETGPNMAENLRSSVEIGSEPSFCRRQVRAASPRIVFQLVAPDPRHPEILGFGMAEVEPADRRRGIHGEILG